MITIIAKKIDAKLSTHETNYERMKNLAHYCANPESKQATEKCVAVKVLNFSDENPSMDRVIDEFTFDMMKSKRQDVELVSHWVISWKGGEPSVDKIFDSAKLLLEDLGYTESNRTLLAIHADTGHLHCHIAVCKVDMWNGKVCREDWYKNEAQRSLARIADKFGWQLEPGARYRVKPDARKQTITVKTTQGMREYTRRIVTKCEKRSPGLAAGAKKFEHRTGMKSAQRQLQEKLINFLDQHHEEMPAWKYGNFHRELAYLGIECKRTQHKGQYFTAFSLDGENYFPASKVCPDLGYDKLHHLLGGRSWRDSRPDLEALRNEARARNEQEIALISQSSFTREELKRLAKIPVEEVYKALGKAPKPDKKDAFAVLSSAGFSAVKAANWLAEKFPKQDRVHENPANETLNKFLASGLNVAPDHMPRARQLAAFMGAMHTDQMRIFTSEITPEHIEKAIQKGDELHEISSKPMPLDRIFKLLPQMEKLESYGIRLTCRPVYNDAKPVIIASDQNSHYEAPREFPLPGGRQYAPMTLTILAHGGKSSIRTEIDTSALTPIPPESLKAKIESQRNSGDVLASEKAQYKPYEPEGEALSGRLLKIYEQEQKLLLDRFLDDRQRAWILADALYRAGATPNQVYTALGESQAAKDVAMRQLPVSFTGSTSEWQRKRTSRKPVSTLAPVDFYMDANAPDARPGEINSHFQKEQKNGRK